MTINKFTSTFGFLLLNLITVVDFKVILGSTILFMVLVYSTNVKGVFTLIQVPIIAT